MKIQDLLKIINRPVITIGPEETVAAAAKKLAQFDRGSIPVCNEKSELVGIITERDIVRKCFTRGESLDRIRVQDIMSQQVAVGIPEDDLDYAVSVMKQKRVRHLPILEDQRVIGLVSMRDLLAVQLGEAEAKVRYAGLLSRRPQRPVV
ncbi:MAG: CBS domain-containing protein [Chloroflexi bacterium]|nr:CBS domain-containing protein [Chloroflexota bacterium]